MSNYKYPTPQLLLKAICNAIRAKTGSNDKIAHQDIPDSINNILTEEECEVESQKLLDIIYGKDMKILDNKYISNIPNSRFYHNNKITTVNLPKCTSIRYAAFTGCTSLTTVNLPECIYMEAWSFKNCTNLTTINLPECTSIGDEAFDRCTSLTTVNLPECTSIGGYAFSNCTNLATVILSNNQVVSLNNINAFTSSPIGNGRGCIYVPDNLVDSYKSDTNWSTYANRIKPLSELPSNLKEEYGYD